MNTFKAPKKIGDFTHYLKTPTSIKYGNLYTKSISLDAPSEQKRTIRVYLPDDYDGVKKHPVIYMTDGQNCFDRYTAAFGFWELDEHIHFLGIKGYQTPIIVGIDCPKVELSRTREYTYLRIPFRHIPEAKQLRGVGTSSYGAKFAKDIVDRIKPIIDTTFSTLKDKENTAFGGSSMGGLFSFDIVTVYKNIFGFALVFSPAVGLYDTARYFREVSRRKIKANDQKFFFYSGGKDYEENFLMPTVLTFNYLKELGFDGDHVSIRINSSEIHHEKAWSKYVKDALTFWLKKGKK